jgi:hypothetical protein
MRIFTDLLFLHGHIANVDLARTLAEEKPGSESESTGFGLMAPARLQRAKTTPPQTSPCLRQREGAEQMPRA